MSTFCSCISTGSWSFRPEVDSGRNGNGRITVGRIDFRAKRRQFFHHVQRNCQQLRIAISCVQDHAAKQSWGEADPLNFVAAVRATQK